MGTGTVTPRDTVTPVAEVTKCEPHKSPKKVHPVRLELTTVGLEIPPLEHFH